MKQKIYLFLALIFALLAAGAVYLYLENLEKEMKADLEYATILVAKDYIPPHTVITKEMISSSDIPLSQVREDILRNQDDILGRTTKTPLFPGESFIGEKLASPGEAKNGLSYSISPGKRAVTVAVNEVVGVGKMLLPGDHVDIVAVLEKKGAESRGIFATLCIQNIRVLAVGQEMVASKTVMEANTVTLEATPAEAQKLVLAEENGSIRLLLRGAAESGTVAVPSFYLDNFN